jgi:hypothetical protein
LVVNGMRLFYVCFGQIPHGLRDFERVVGHYVLRPSEY